MGWNMSNDFSSEITQQIRSQKFMDAPRQNLLKYVQRIVKFQILDFWDDRRWITTHGSVSVFPRRGQNGSLLTPSPTVWLRWELLAQNMYFDKWSGKFSVISWQSLEAMLYDVNFSSQLL